MAILYYPELLTNDTAFPAHIVFTFYERNSTSSSSETDQIHLYMPEQFSQPNTVSWDSSFKAGQAILGTISAASSTLTPSSITSNSLYQTMQANLRKMQEFGNAAKDLGSLASGMMLNPYLAQLFRGVDFRNFSYTFRFVPFSAGDCNTILEILNTFRRWSLPDGPSGAGDPRLFYPGEVEIDYYFAGERNKYLHRFKRCVITNININYTGAGMWTMMRNGFPTETILNISFSEIEIVVRKDVDAGY